MKKNKENLVLETDIEYEGIAKYMPIIICGGFFLLSILLFAFGPFDWNVNNENRLYIFLISSFFALILGYVTGTRIKVKKKLFSYNMDYLMYIAFIVYIVMYIAICYITTGKLYPDIYTGLFNSGLAYKMSHSPLTKLGTYVTYANIILSPLVSMIIPYFLIYKKNRSKKIKIIGYSVLVLNLIRGISQGVISAYAIFSFQIIMFLIIYLFSNLKKESLKKKIGIVLIIIMLCISFLLYYKIVMGNRLAADASYSTDSNYVKEKANNSKKNDNKKNSETANDVNVLLDSSAEYITHALIKDKHIFSFLPESIQGSLNHIISYVTHGYKGLSFALQKKFTSSYGLGFSDFFRHNFLKIIGKSNLEQEIYKRTYMFKILDNGWETGAVWSSFFIYPASDIGFPMTIVLVFFIGLIFSLSWRDALESKNVFAGVIFLNLCMIICFFSANNVYFQEGGSFLTMITMSILWLLTKKFGKEG